MNTTDRIYIAGHQGLIGRALYQRLSAEGYQHLIVRRRADLDLTDQKRVADFFRCEKPDYVFLCAAKTGGIFANTTYRGDFLYENLTIQTNVIHQAFAYGVKKLMFFACSCIYPKGCAIPIREEDLLTGTFEKTNEAFAIAKIAGLKLCESYNRQYGTEFLTIIPTNVYGPGQRYDPDKDLVVPALIRKIFEAKCKDLDEVRLWGSGTPMRDFLFVDDLAEASLHLMRKYGGDVLVNVGTGVEHSISELAAVIRLEIGFKGALVFDQAAPDGVDSKLQDISLMKSLGWEASTSLREGIHRTCRDFMRHYNGDSEERSNSE